ncbi:MAG TPA: type II toxin-antitoxin system mRNA interferase toxin, RelE/StbE family [Xanthomonadaceae bacterium]|nr:type II toxin-antitoxin system mRNA interferase toxin, RelE/StbE family [Xanthomonadaceae bacterium]
MTLPIAWQQTAREDLVALIRFISEHNTYAARDLKQRLESGVLPLGDSPYLGRPGRVPGTRELLVHPNYWVIYRVDLTCVEIANILHARREYP